MQTVIATIENKAMFQPEMPENFVLISMDISYEINRIPFARLILLHLE